MEPSGNKMKEIKYNVLKAIYESSDEATLFEMPIDVIQNHNG